MRSMKRRQFAWSEFRKARSEKKHVRFDGGSLIIGGHPVKKFDPVELPTTSNMLQGLQSPTLIVGTSEVLVEDTHTFQAWATPVSSLYMTSVRDTTSCCTYRNWLVLPMHHMHFVFLGPMVVLRRTLLRRRH